MRFAWLHLPLLLLTLAVVLHTISASAARTAASVGFEGVWSKTACGSAPSASSARSSTPAARTPASVTTSGYPIALRAHSCGSSRRLPKSRWIWVM